MKPEVHLQALLSIMHRIATHKPAPVDIDSAIKEVEEEGMLTKEEAEALRAFLASAPEPDESEMGEIVSSLFLHAAIEDVEAMARDLGETTMANVMRDIRIIHAIGGIDLVWDKVRDIGERIRGSVGRNRQEPEWIA